MRECLTYCSHPHELLWGEAPPLGSGLPSGEEEMDFTSIKHRTGQGGGEWHTRTLLQGQSSHQNCHRPTLPLSASFSKVGEEPASLGEVRSFPSMPSMTLHECVGTLLWVLFPWPGCPWLLQDHPGGHWPVLDDMQVPVCWEEKGLQSLANFSHAGHRTAVC